MNGRDYSNERGYEHPIEAIKREFVFKARQERGEWMGILYRNGNIVSAFGDYPTRSQMDEIVTHYIDVKAHHAMWHKTGFTPTFAAVEIDESARYEGAKTRREIGAYGDFEPNERRFF